MLQRRLVRTQRFQLMLGEVAVARPFAFQAAAAGSGSSFASSLISVDFAGAVARPSRPMRSPGAGSA